MNHPATFSDPEPVELAPKRRLALVLVCALAVAAAVIAIASGGVTTEDPLSAPTTAAPQSPHEPGLSEALVYDDLAQMQATSDLVVSGSVVAIKPGRTIGGSEAQDESAPLGGVATEPTAEIQLNEVVVQVDEWLGGTAKIDAGSEIVLEEEAPAAFLAPSSAIGDSGIYFVREKADRPGAYVLSGSPARFLRTSNSTVLRGSNPEIGWAAAAASQSFDELRAEIHKIQDQVERSEIEPSQP